MANILFINPLQERHGSTYRARQLQRLLSVNHRVSYVEADPRKPGNNVAVCRPDSGLGLCRAVIEYLRACWGIGFDILYLQKPMILTWPCLLLAKLKGKCVIIDFDDVDSLWQTSAWKTHLTALSERLMPKSADLITTHNRYLRTYIGRNCNKRLALIPQGVDTDLFNPKRFKKAAERERLGLGGKKIFCFLGSFTKGSAADLDIILEAFKSMAQGDRHALLMIIGGGGPLEAYYTGLMENLGVRNQVIVTGRKHQKDIPRYLSCADYGLVCMRDNFANRCRVSLKLLEYLAMELTVIGHVVGSSRDAFASYCFLCDPSAEALSETMLEVMQSQSRKESARDFIVDNYDWNRFVPLMDEVIDECKILRHVR
jgi:glycosyltransferase involved in cell wall biosynthesis